MSLKNNHVQRIDLLERIITVDEERLSLLSVIDNCSFSIKNYVSWLTEKELRLINRFKRKFGIYPPAGNDLVWINYHQPIADGASCFNE
ncbi:MAG: hypothetical protein ACYDDC_03235 [Thermoplasmataceae archaeon]